MTLAKPATTLAMVVFLCSLFLCVTGVPMVKREIHSFVALIKSFAEFTSFVEEGNFNKISDSTTIYINSKDGPNAFSGIVIYDYDKHNDSRFITVAESAIVTNKDDQLVLTLKKGSRQMVYKNDLHSINFESLTTSISIERSIIRSGLYVTEQSLYALLTNDSTDPDTKQSISKEIVDRFSWPLLSLGFAYVAVAAALNTAFSRLESLSSIAVGVLCVFVYVAFYFWIKTLNNLTVALCLIGSLTALFMVGSMVSIAITDSRTHSKNNIIKYVSAIRGLLKF